MRKICLWTYNENIILHRLPEETQRYLPETDRHANGAMQWINGSLSCPSDMCNKCTCENGCFSKGGTKAACPTGT